MSWCPRQMPNTGTVPSSSRHASIPYVVAAGSPGPFDRNTPSNPPERTSAAGVVAGTTVASIPAAASRRRMFRFRPKSYAATR